jgi:hypothetical protein
LCSKTSSSSRKINGSSMGTFYPINWALQLYFFPHGNLFCNA